MEEFNIRLQKAMDILGVSAAELSRRTGLSQPLISQWLSGKFKAKSDKVYLVASVLHINPAWLLGYDVPMQEIKTETPASDETIISLFAELPKDKKAQVEQFIQFLKGQQ